LLSEVPGLDVGLTRTLLPGGGEITPSTASSAAKDGGKETFVVFDETHLYKDPDLRRMYQTVTRNLRKRKKIAGTWYLETTTMFAPGEESVAEGTYRLSEAIAEGRTRRERLLVDHRWGECEDPTDEQALRAAIVEAYGDAIAWNDLDGHVDEFYDPRADIADSRRYFLNAETETSDAWLAARQWDGCAAPLVTFPDRELVTLGFDGSVSADATALVACRVLDGHVELLKCDERPEDAPVGWQVDQVAVDAEVAAAFERFDVVAFYADPPHWQDYIDKWTTEFGARLRVKASVKHPIEWWTNRPAAVVAALKRFHDAVAEGRLTHDGTTQLRRHVLNARRRVSRAGIQVSKDYPGSPRKIDAAMASVLAYEARGDAVAAGFARPRRARRAVGF
ncbi:MAG: Terminase, partial [Pseudonocardiaceae bacterium]